MRVLVLSPHRDDAAFSCGLTMLRLLRAGAAITVINICTVSSYAPFSLATKRSLEEVTALRRTEDDVFVQTLREVSKARHEQVVLLDLEWQDLPIRWQVEDEEALAPAPLRPVEVNQLTEQLEAFTAADLVFAPFALGGHLDHRLVRSAAEQAFPEASLYFYEDLPYGCYNPTWSADGGRQELAEATSTFANLDAVPGGMKRSFAMCYPSQIGAEMAERMDLHAARQGGLEQFVATPGAIEQVHLALFALLDLKTYEVLTCPSS